jgi:hypothetical protein
VRHGGGWGGRLTEAIVRFLNAQIVTDRLWRELEQDLKEAWPIRLGITNSCTPHHPPLKRQTSLEIHHNPGREPACTTK